MKRYVVARHGRGLSSLVYIADMETGEVAETLISLRRTGRTCIVITAKPEHLLTRICAPKTIGCPFARPQYEYRVPSNFFEADL